VDVKTHPYLLNHLGWRGRDASEKRNTEGDRTVMATRTDKEIREWVKVQFGHLPKAQQRKIRADMEYVRDFYEADGHTPSAFGQAVMKAYPRADETMTDKPIDRRERMEQQQAQRHREKRKRADIEWLREHMDADNAPWIESQIAKIESTLER
jgi:hypothetical protein